MAMVRIAVMGRASVGKSCLSIRFTQNTFVKEYEPTIENSYKKTMTVDGKSYCVDILDTAGMESVDAMKTSMLRQKDCYVLVYSIADRESFDSISQYHEDIARIRDESEHIPCILCGNKSDLAPAGREVTEEEGKELAKKIGSVFMETSAATGSNVSKAIEAAVREALKSKPKVENTHRKGFFETICIIL